MNDKVALIAVSFNKAVITKLVRSLAKQESDAFTLYIIDVSGNSHQYPYTNDRMKVIKTKNKGYANGVNVGIKAALKDGIEKFCVINDDTYVKSNFVLDVQKNLLHHPRSITGGKIYYAPGHEFHADRYKKNDLGNVLWYAGGYVDWKHSQPKHRGVDEVDKKQYDTEERTEFITGCLMIFDKAVIDAIGYWDESYFLYYEDADFCERAKRKGLPLWYDPSVIVWHLISQSTGGSGSEIHKVYQKKNLVIFGLKYAPWRTKLHLVKNYFLR